MEEIQKDLYNSIIYNKNLDNVLLKNNYDINFRYSNGNTPLHLYIMHTPNDYNYINYYTSLFLSNGSNVNILNNYGHSPLHFAIMENYNVKIIETFLEYFDDVNIMDKFGNSLLHYAVIYNTNYDVIKLLIDYGINTNIENYYNIIPLYYAIKHKLKTKIILLLLNNYDFSKINNKIQYMSNNTLLHLALFNRCGYKVIKKIIKYVDNVNINNNYLNTPLHYAIMKKYNYDIIKLLLDKGANINLLNIVRRTPLHYAIIKKYNIDIIKILLNNFDNINILDDKNNNLLHYILLKIQVEYDFYDEYDGIGFGYTYINDYNTTLYDENDDEEDEEIEDDDDGDNILIYDEYIEYKYSKENIHYSNGNKYIHNYIDLDDKIINNNFIENETDIHIYRFEIIKLLLENKIDINKKNIYGISAINYINEISKDNIDMINYLIKNNIIIKEKLYTKIKKYNRDLFTNNFFMFLYSNNFLFLNENYCNKNIKTNSMTKMFQNKDLIRHIISFS